MTDLQQQTLFGQHIARALLEHTRDRVALLQEDGTLLEWNPAFGVMKDSRPQAVRLQDFVAASSQAAFTRLLQTAQEKDAPRKASLELLVGKQHRAHDCLLIPIPEDGNFLFMAEPASHAASDEVARLTRDLRATKRALRVKQTGLESVLAQAQEIAHIDQLTFLANQRKIVGDLQRKVTQSVNSRKPLTIFMLDIDHFKRINDTYGHLAGDEVLRMLANRLRDSMRQSDVIGRYGGEEFLILLPGTLLESAIPLAERLLKMVRTIAIEVGEQAVRVNVSIGIAQYMRGENWRDFLERADKALYQSKKNGRDRWTASEPE